MMNSPSSCLTTNPYNRCYLDFVFILFDSASRKLTNTSQVYQTTVYQKDQFLFFFGSWFSINRKEKAFSRDTTALDRISTTL